MGIWKNIKQDAEQQEAPARFIAKAMCLHLSHKGRSFSHKRLRVLLILTHILSK
jgi:hypothetical protein